MYAQYVPHAILISVVHITQVYSCAYFALLMGSGVSRW